MKKSNLVLQFSLLFLLINSSLPAYTKQPVKYKKIQKYVDQATGEKLAGVVIYIKSPEYEEWITTSGYANLENKQVLQKDHIFSIASIGKMYNAVAVLKLAEEGRINLDDKIEEFLPSEIIENLPNAKDVTIRHLLGHRTGWVNYDKDPELNRLYLSGHLKLDTLSHVEALERYVYGKNPLFSPGASFNYSSTNYLLLAMIVDNIVPEGHSVYLNNMIKNYGFTNTYYRQTPPQMNVSYYGDLNQDETLENITDKVFETTNWFTGDDGIYASVEDAAHFLQDLMHGKILSQQYLKEMTEWDNEKDPDYGLGLMSDKSFPYGLTMGHSGNGIGVRTDLYYFPKQDITVAIFCNNGLRAAAPGFEKAYNKMRFKIVRKLFLF